MSAGMEIYIDVFKERQRQDEMWGGAEHDDDHNDDEWAEYIEERTGKLKGCFSSEKRARELYIHIAALAVAAIEAIDRKRATAKEMMKP